MGFSDFHSNSAPGEGLRTMLARDRFPHAVLLAGPLGAGKFTLAQMVAKAMNCLAPPAGKLPDFCGRCSNCQRIGQADDLAARFHEAVEARESLRETDRKLIDIYAKPFQSIQELKQQLETLTPGFVSSKFEIAEE